MSDQIKQTLSKYSNKTNTLRYFTRKRGKGSKCKATCDPAGNILKIKRFGVVKGAKRKLTSWPLVQMQLESFFSFSPFFS